MSPSPHSKKRKVAVADSNVVATKKSKSKTALSVLPKRDDDAERAALHQEIGYEPLTLQDIHDRIVDLCRRVPRIPADAFALAADVTAANGDAKAAEASSTVPVATTPCAYNQIALRQWASELQTVLEEFHLLIAVVSAATYKWGTDRTGAADQNLNLLSSELVRAQEQILGRVTPRLNDVLAPVLTVLTDKTVTTKHRDDTETKQNYFVTATEDPDYVVQCYTALARNAGSLRQVVLANFDKLLSAVTDYLAAQHQDNQHDSRGFVY